MKDGLNGYDSAKHFNLATALEFFAAQMFLAYRTDEQLRKSVDTAVDSVMKCHGSIGKADATEEVREMLLAPIFEGLAKDFSRYWLSDEQTE